MNHQQTKLISLIEAVSNTAIGFLISLLTWYVIIWTQWFPIQTSHVENIAITLIFTVVSIARSYFLRRVFIRFHLWLMERFA